MMSCLYEHDQDRAYQVWAAPKGPRLHASKSAMSLSIWSRLNYLHFSCETLSATGRANDDRIIVARAEITVLILKS